MKTLVERWRTKPHTFHPPLGEATFTLEYLSVQLDLLIDGKPITDVSSCDLVFHCKGLLGSLSPKMTVKGNSINYFS